MKYNKEVKERIILLAEEGYTNNEICKKIKINKTTLYDWLNKDSNFSDSLKKAKQVVDETVEAKLYKRAMGYKYKETTRELSNLTKSLVISKVVTKEMPPDVTAQIFWLKNRQPQKWRDKTFVEQEGDAAIRVKLPKAIEEKLLSDLKHYEK